MTDGLSRFPAAEVLIQARGLIREDENLPEVLELLRQYPGLTGPIDQREWYKAFPVMDPLICRAVELGKVDTVRALLDAGCSPSAPTRNSGVGGDALCLALSKCGDDNILACAEMLAHHTDAVFTYVHASKVWPHADSAHQLFSGSLPEASLERRKALFGYLFDHIPARYINADFDPFSEVMRGAVSSDDTETRHVATMVRLLVDRGCSANAPYSEVTYHLVHEAHERSDKKSTAEIIAVLMAAGMQKDCLIDPIDYEEREANDEPITLGQHLINLSQGSSTERACAQQINEKLREILDGEIAQVTSGKVSPEQLLFTPQGRASWQAQGLVVNHRIEELFDREHTALFGGREQQISVAYRLHDALSEQQRAYFSPAGLLREEKLAQPDNAATVRYLRGADVTTGKGAA